MNQTLLEPDHQSALAQARAYLASALVSVPASGSACLWVQAAFPEALEEGEAVAAVAAAYRLLSAAFVLLQHPAPNSTTYI